MQSTELFQGYKQRTAISPSTAVDRILVTNKELSSLPTAVDRTLVTNTELSSLPTAVDRTLVTNTELSSLPTAVDRTLVTNKELSSLPTAVDRTLVTNTELSSLPTAVDRTLVTNKELSSLPTAVDRTLVTNKELSSLPTGSRQNSSYKQGTVISSYCSRQNSFKVSLQTRSCHLFLLQSTELFQGYKHRRNFHHISYCYSRQSSLKVTNKELSSPFSSRPRFLSQHQLGTASSISSASTVSDSISTEKLGLSFVGGHTNATTTR